MALLGSLGCSLPPVSHLKMPLVFLCLRNLLLSAGVLNSLGGLDLVSGWWWGVSRFWKYRTDLGAHSLGWEEAGPTRPGLVLHAELDKAGGSEGPGLLSLATCCSGRAFLNAELELGTAGVAREAGTGLGVVPMLSARASENLARYCLTTGSCGATGGWLKAGGKGQGTAAW